MSDARQTPLGRTAKNTLSPDVSMTQTKPYTTAAESYYVPILRDGPIERDVVRQFGGLNRFEERPRGLLPLVEILDSSDLDLLDPYRDVAGEVLLDVPYYLTERANDYQDDVVELISDFDNVSDFFNSHVDQIDIPVLSHSIEKPMNYGEFITLYHQLSNEYDQAGIRLFVDTTEVTETQESALTALSNEITDDVLIFFDLIDVGGFDRDENMIDKLRSLSNIFERNETIVLNAFQPFDAANLNYGPTVTEECDLDGFGDFVINRRIVRSFPAGDVDRTIRHYFPSDSELNEFVGEDYNEAQEELLDDPEWDGTHCNFCRQAEREGGHHRFWKEVRMGHYIDSVLSAESI